jgi:hypothetical protein
MRASTNAVTANIPPSNNGNRRVNTDGERVRRSSIVTGSTRTAFGSIAASAVESSRTRSPLGRVPRTTILMNPGGGTCANGTYHVAIDLSSSLAIGTSATTPTMRSESG